MTGSQGLPLRVKWKLLIPSSSPFGFRLVPSFIAVGLARPDTADASKRYSAAPVTVRDTGAEVAHRPRLSTATAVRKPVPGFNEDTSVVYGG